MKEVKRGNAGDADGTDFRRSYVYHSRNNRYSRKLENRRFSDWKD